MNSKEVVTVPHVFSELRFYDFHLSCLLFLSILLSFLHSFLVILCLKSNRSHKKGRKRREVMNEGSKDEERKGYNNVSRFRMCLMCDPCFLIPKDITASYLSLTHWFRQVTESLSIFFVVYHIHINFQTFQTLKNVSFFIHTIRLDEWLMKKLTRNLGLKHFWQTTLVYLGSEKKCDERGFGFIHTLHSNPQVSSSSLH